MNSQFYPTEHANEEECTITVLQDGDYSLSSTFGIEECCDDLEVAGVDVNLSEDMPETLSAVRLEV